jgi:hypothetical protein
VERRQGRLALHRWAGERVIDTLRSAGHTIEQIGFPDEIERGKPAPDVDFLLDEDLTALDGCVLSRDTMT